MVLFGNCIDCINNKNCSKKEYCLGCENYEAKTYTLEELKEITEKFKSNDDPNYNYLGTMPRE